MKQPSKEINMWFAVLTRNRCEKAVQRFLEMQQIKHYLPIISLPRLHGTRRRIVNRPLIPGYIFVHISLYEYVRVLQTEHVVDLVRFGTELIPIPQEEIDLLKKFCMNVDHEIIIGRPRYQPGDIVQVISGPLKGVIGKLMNVQGRKNLVVELKNVGYSFQIVEMKPQHVRCLSVMGV
ncbi:MAG: UpxY family transcription antiterminator [Saprospiraceae bacterium]|nr:UpxY family transcription antiterminator [Lewinella sp.]